MRNLTLLVLLFTSLVCKADSWTRKADFPGGPRVGAYAFTIGNKAYVGGGADSVQNFYNDLWEYDPSTNNWTQKNNFPGMGRGYAASFSIGNKGYVCCGTSFSFPSQNVYKDLWEYNPMTNSWSPKADFLGTGRYYPVSFVIGNLGYVGTGTDSVTFLLSDFYAFDPTTNVWSSIAPISSTGYTDGVAFVVGNKAYVTGLFSSNNICTDTLCQYDPVLNSWTIKSNFPDTPRTDAAAFSINGMGYFGTGDKAAGGNKLCNDFWQYNPNTNFWTQKASLPSTTRDETAYFVIGNKGYLCFGGENLNSELWEYTPDSTANVQGLNTQPFQTSISPNPFTTTTTITFTRGLQNADLCISDISGREIEKYKNINGTEFILHRNDLASGIYFYQLVENGLIIAKDKIDVQ